MQDIVSKFLLSKKKPRKYKLSTRFYVEPDKQQNKLTYYYKSGKTSPFTMVPVVEITINDLDTLDRTLKFLPGIVDCPATASISSVILRPFYLQHDSYSWCTKLGLDLVTWTSLKFRLSEQTRTYKNRTLIVRGGEEVTLAGNELDYRGFVPYDADNRARMVLKVLDPAGVARIHAARLELKRVLMGLEAVGTFRPEPDYDLIPNKYKPSDMLSYYEQFGILDQAAIEFVNTKLRYYYRDYHGHAPMGVVKAIIKNMTAAIHGEEVCVRRGFAEYVKYIPPKPKEQGESE